MSAVKKANMSIVATSQTSRFHADTLITLSREIDLKQVNISVGGNDLLVDAHLRLKTGVHYTLVGRNGEGKSVLLKAIADNIIPGFPANIRVLLVGQTDTLSSPDSVTSTELTVTQRVLKTEARREKALSEYQPLSSALASASPEPISLALAQVRLYRARDDLLTAQKIAMRRSGTRGSEARKALLAAESDVVECENRLKDAEQGKVQESDIGDAVEMLKDLEMTLDALGAHTAEARTRSILIGLGFSLNQLDEPYTNLSGGWRSRCALAAALLQGPDLLILDEPTNYLDLPSVIWLQDYLSTFLSTLLVVAHDREFIDDIASSSSSPNGGETIVLRNKSLSYFPGNFTLYERVSRKKRRGDIRAKEAMDRKKEAVEKSIEAGMRSAKKSGDDNRAKMVKSRQKKLDERWGLEKSAKGGRFKLNRDLAGYHLTSRGEITVDDIDKPISFSFPDPDGMRFPGALISVNGVSFTYSKQTGKVPAVIKDVNLIVHPRSRTAFVGNNGEGKSTLVKLLIGMLPPTLGKIERHPRLRLGYFDQHSVERLSGDAPNTSALAYFLENVKDIDEGRARAFLGNFGLGGRKAVEPIVGLSGGQKVRLALALVVYAAPDLLVLDEPSTHLDVDSIKALIIALKSYTGAVIIVSHDRYLVKCVVEGDRLIPPGDEDDDDDESEGDEEADDAKEEQGTIRTVYKVGPKGRVRVLGGGMDDYVAIVRKRLQK